MSPPQQKLTVMFADVSGSAALFERLGDTEALHAVDRCLKRMKRSIDAYGGRTVETMGDELLATFATAEDGCQAAIDMQQRIADLPPVSGLKLTIRIGLHSGLVDDDAGRPSGEVVTNTARIAGIARRDQILGSSALVSAIVQQAVINVRPMPELGTVLENGVPLDLFQVHWIAHEAPPPDHFSLIPATSTRSERLCIRYRGKSFLLDDKTPNLSLGRDLGNKLVIEDRKASRQHARVEKREDGYYLVDTSTNGCFVRFSGRHEVMVRRHALLLEGSGRICFGTSCNDASADGAEFEYL